MPIRPYQLRILLLSIWCLIARLCSAQPDVPARQVRLHDGRHLALHCEGQGAPLILLESGYGSDSLTWRRLQPLLAKHNQVCSYDRAGERFVAPGPFPRDLNAMVADLHDLASSAELPKPFVLVGHSMGGMSALLYTERYGADVSALVLLDPGMPGMLRAYKALSQTSGNDEVLSGLVQLSRCRALASDPNKQAELLSACSWRDPGLNEQQNAEADKIIQRPAFWDTLLSTDLALRAPQTAYDGYRGRFSAHWEPPLDFPPQSDETLDERELRLAEHPLGTIPLIIVSVKSSPVDRKAWAIKRKQYQLQAKTLSSRGQVIDVGDTSHNVQLDRPERVVEIVSSVLK